MSDQVIMNGAPLATIEERLLDARAIYGNAFSDIMDRVLEEFLLVDDKTALLLDAMQFATFMLCIKTVEAKMQPVTKENLMAVYWPMQKALKDDVPGMLRQFAAAVLEAAKE